MLSIANGELVQLFRNRLVLVTSVLLPIAFSAFFLYQHELFAKIGSLGYIAAMTLFFVGVVGLYATTVTTLAARRQNLFLKRLRSTAVSDRSILAGLLLPITAITVVQAAVILIVLGTVTGPPKNPFLLVIAVIATIGMLLAFGLATAGLTNSPEHAQVTTLPIMIGVLAVASWVGISGTDQLGLLKRLLPGGSATELVLNAWNGGASLTDSLILLAPIAAWLIVSIALATWLFRWEPRR